jgi:alpha-glucosidase (family GH31 glycosyl hydrolase)
MLNLAMGGGFTFISDIGGYLDLYTPPTTAELFTRWAQLSALTPVMRVHDDTYHGSRYPWSFDARTLDAYRRYARLKVRLIPLVERWSERAATDGTIGPVRPLVLDDPSPAARAIEDEWLLGADVLAAPILTEGAVARRVYLPAGALWQRVRVGEQGQWVPAGAPISGGRTITAPAPYADIPIYLRVLQARLRLACGTGRVRDELRGADLRGVVRTDLVRRAGRVAARLILEEGRTVWLSARVPRCRRA